MVPKKQDDHVARKGLILLCALAACGELTSRIGDGTCRECVGGTICVQGECLAPCAATSQCGVVQACGRGYCRAYAAGCTSSEDCAEGWKCDVNTCRRNLANGDPCTSGGICPVDHCVDGVCCETPCDGACESCNGDSTGLASGQCEPVLPGLDPRDDCPLGLACDGATACYDSQKADPCRQDHECATGHCSEGVCCESQCGGTCEACAKRQTGQPDGTCAPIPDRQDPDDECSAGFGCNGAGACYQGALPGDACSQGYDCDSGTCAQGDFVCCDLPCDGICRSCLAARTGLKQDGLCGNVPETEDDGGGCPTLFGCDGQGACKPGLTPGEPCTVGLFPNECGDGLCVDGVCCDARCSEPCNACIKGFTGVADGTCSAVAKGTDPKNRCGTDPTAGHSCSGGETCLLRAGQACDVDDSTCDHGVCGDNGQCVDPTLAALWAWSFGGTQQPDGRSGDGEINDKATDIAMDAEGNLFVVGIFDRYLRFTGKSLGTDIDVNSSFILKMTTDGSVVWDQAIVPVAGRVPLSCYDDRDHCDCEEFWEAGDTMPAAVATLPNGDAVVVGTFSGRIDFGNGDIRRQADFSVEEVGCEGGSRYQLHTPKSEDIFVARYRASDGLVWWAHAYGGSLLQRAVDVTVNDAGDIVLLGTSEDDVDFGSGTLPTQRSAAVLAVLDSGSGIGKWATTIDSSADDEGRAIAAGADNALYYVASLGGKIGLGAWALKAGTVLGRMLPDDPSDPTRWGIDWTDNIEGAGTDLAIDATGSMIVVGVDTTNSGSTDSSHGFVRKLGPTGLLEWSVPLTGSSSATKTRPTAVTTDPAGNTIVIGYFPDELQAEGVTLHTATNNPDGFVLFLGPGGELVWSDVITGDLWQVPVGAVVDPSDNALIIAGHFGSGGGNFNGGSEPIVLESTSAYDFFVAHYSRTP